MSVTVSNGSITVDPDCYTLDFYKSGDNSNSLGSTFPTQPDTYFVVATGIETKGYEGKVSSSEFTISGLTEISLTDCTLKVSVSGKSATLKTSSGENVPTDAYTLDYEQRISNGDPITLSGFPTSGGIYFAVATAVPGKGYTGSVQSEDFTIGDGAFTSIEVDTLNAKVTVKDSSGTAIGESNYELVFWKYENGNEKKAGSSFPTEPGTYAVTAKGKGTAYGESMITSTKFTVTAASPSAKKLKLNVTTTSVRKGYTVQLKATYNGYDSTTSVTWKSSNNSVATVGEHTGIVTGISAGKATITAVADEEASCVVTVTDDGETPAAPITPTTPETPADQTAQEETQTPADQNTQNNTETTNTKDESGNDVTTTKTTNSDGSVTENSVVRDPSGKVISESEKTSSTVTDTAGVETTIEKIVEKDASGKETVTDTTIVKDTTGTVTEDSTTKKSDGTESQTRSVRKTSGEKESTTVEKDQSGQIVAVSTEQTARTGDKTSNFFGLAENGGLMLVETTTTGGKLVVPAEVLTPDGGVMPVTTIGENAFTDIGDATKIVIPFSVRYIEKGAFDGMPGRTRVRLTVTNAGGFTVQDGAASGFKKKTVVVIWARNRTQFNRIVRKLKNNGGDKAEYRFKRLRDEDED